MEELGQAPKPPSQEEMIAACESHVQDVMKSEHSDDTDADRVWILRKNFNNFLYHQGLQNYAPQLIESILQFNAGNSMPLDPEDEEWTGAFDFTQKHYTGFLRKFVAIIGNRMPNAIAVPDDPDDEEAVRAAKSADNAGIWVREKCDFEGQHLEQSSRMFDFATTFWHIDWVEDGDKYGWKDEPQFETQQVPLGNAAFECPQCGTATPSDTDPQQAPAQCPNCGAPLSMDHYKPPQTVEQPVQTGTKKVPNGHLEVKLRDSNEVWVPLDAYDIANCDWLRWEREEPKGKVLRELRQKYTKPSPDGQGDVPMYTEEDFSTNSALSSNSTQLGEMIRSAMASPLALVRVNRANRWTCEDVWWTPNQYELGKNEAVKKILRENFPEGIRWIFKRGKLVEMRAEKLQDHWQECKPEPHCRIMTQALGDEWTDTTDVANNTTNMMEENVSRSNLPLLVNALKWDETAWANRRTKPGETFPILPRAGMPIGNEVYQPQAVQYSEQVPQFQERVIEFAKNNTGLNDAIWGGGEPDPTARQTLLKTNQALMQLGLFWTQIRKCLEQVLLKSCKVLSEYTEGIVAFSKKNQFGRYNKVSFIAEDLKSDKYHFEADEAIPINWGQQRDQLMWLLGQASENPELLKWLGITDPKSVFEIKQLLGIPGMYTPYFDAREKCMDTIEQLIADGAAIQPLGPPNPDGSAGAPGPKQSSIQPDWEDPADFFAELVKDFLLDNADLKKSNPPAYENVQLYGQACQQMANPPQPPPPPKATVSLALKGADLGSPAVQAALQNANIEPQGGPLVVSDTDKAVAMQQAMQQAMPPQVPPPATTQPPQ